MVGGKSANSNAGLFAILQFIIYTFVGFNFILFIAAPVDITIKSC
mgnify:CR=1 FL=1